MKRIISVISAFSAALLVLAACGDKSGTENKAPLQFDTESSTAAEPTTVPELHERHDYEDGVLIGHWEGDYSDLVFQENGMVSATFDISSFILFTHDGKFMINGETYPEDSVYYDGSLLKVSVPGGEGEEPAEILSLVRVGEPVPEDIDGEYTIDSELLRDSLSSAIGAEDTDIDIHMTIRNERCFIELPDFCSYIQNGDELKLSGEALEVSGIGDTLSDCTFVLEDGVCTFYDSTGYTDEYVKAEE